MSDTIPPAAGSTPATAAASTTPTGVALAASSTTVSLAVGTSTMRISEKTFSTSNWPKDLILDIGKDNWHQWSTRICVHAKRQGFLMYLDGSLKCPDESSSPEAYWIWKCNDVALQGFIQESLSEAELALTCELSTAHAMFEALRDRHEKSGPFAQIQLLKQFLEIFFDDDDDQFNHTCAKIEETHKHIMAMGVLDADRLLIFGYIHALRDKLPHIQSTIQIQSESPGFSSRSVKHLLDQEYKLIRKRRASTPQIALAASSTRPPRAPCGNCNRPNHSTEYCISPGGKLAGKTIEEARAIQAAHRLAPQSTPRTRPPRNPAPPASHQALVSTHPPTHSQFLSVNGAQYALITPSPPPPDADPSWEQDATAYSSISPEADPSWNPPAPHTPMNTAYTSILPPVRPSTPFFYRSYLAHIDNPPQFDSLRDVMDLLDDPSSDLDDPVTSASFSTPTSFYPDSPAHCSWDWATRWHSAFAASTSPGFSLVSPFIFDSGASCHISPARSDFKTFRSITARPVTGLGGSAVYATGCGSVDVSLPAGQKLTLHDVLYIPSSDVRLVSVHSLNSAGNYTSHFNSHSCWVTDRSGTTVARGTILPGRNLYIFPMASASVPSFSLVSNSAHLARRIPDVETWHRRLGHCNHRTIIEMARAGVVEGMPINLSSSPPKCDPCVMGKQTRSTVPKVREGVRATRPLERIFLDLCGPMSVMSRSGRRYSMNVIDDFSNYVWSLPLRTKDEALSIFRDWHTAVENQSGHRLTFLITDNGELASRSMSAFCSEKGITHLFTAPYTSAHNGRAERLHRTLNEKSRTMRIACNAPQNMWDEFSATAAVLTNFTPSSALNGRTPYEYWFRRVPSLSHLREIGCRAYALIHANNPKLNPRSIPCIMIGYGTRSKTYRLWDPASNKIFDSYHVSFIEHLDTEPSPLYPNMTLGSATADLPGSWINPLQPSPPPLRPSSPSVPPSSPIPHRPILSAPYNAPSLPLPPHSPHATRLSTRSTPTTNTLNPDDNTAPYNTHSITTNNNANNNAQYDTNTNNNVHYNTNTNNNVHYDTNTNNNAQNIDLNNTIHSDNNNNTASYDTNYDTPSNNESNRAPLPNNIPHVNPPPSSNSRLTPLSPAPPLRRSSRIPVSSHRDITADGLNPSSRLTTIKADMAASTTRRLADRHYYPTPSASLASSAPFHPYPPNDPLASAFLSEYSPIRDTHDLFHLSISPSSSTIDHALLSLSNGTLVPVPESDDDPLWSKALASPEREYWIAGARDEIRSLEDLKVFVLVPRSDMPRGQRPLKGKLVCKRKRDDAGNVVRYKVRYVAKGYTQRYGIDYDKTTAPTARLESFRALLHIGSSLDWDIQQYDVKTAFLHGVLPETETMFMEQPPGFESHGKETWVWKLMKSIYGMKQASRVWNQTFDLTVRQWGFKRIPCEWCVYHRSSPQGTIMFAVHVDDIISIASTKAANDHFKSQLDAKWKISDLGEAKFALGIAITRDRSDRSISLSQTALIDRIVSEFGQSDAHPVDTPMIAGLRLLRPDKAAPVEPSVATWMEKTPYRALLGSLNYISVGTRPDIAYAVGRLASFLDCYRPEHWEAAIRVVRYLKGTRLLSLRLGGPANVTLLGYSDSDYANCLETSRSIGGYCFSLGAGAISWASRKQKTVADSSCYAEYIALHEASHEAVFLRELLATLLGGDKSPTPLYCDNDAASILTQDHVWHARVKHIRVKYHYVRELVADGELLVKRVRSSDNTADILTKPLGRTDFHRLRHNLGLRYPPGIHITS